MLTWGVWGVRLLSYGLYDSFFREKLWNEESELSRSRRSWKLEQQSGIKYLVVTLRHVVLIFHGRGVATGSTVSYASGSAVSFYVFSGESGTRESAIKGEGGDSRKVICTFLDLFTNVLNFSAVRHDVV
jgi:hypothetical protein